MYIFTPNTLIESAKVNANFAEITTMQSAWSDWTPTFGNLTLGNGTFTAKYKQIGKTVFGRVRFVFGSTSSMTASTLTFTPPVTPASNFAQAVVGGCYIEDLVTTGYEGNIRMNSTSQMIIVVFLTGGTYATSGGVANTVPMTWATGDFFAGSFMYEAV